MSFILNFCSHCIFLILVMRLQITEKVLAKCGLSKNFSSRTTKRSQYFFHETNLQKNSGMEKYWRVSITNRSIIHVIPHFANTMLGDVLVF